MIIFVPGIKGSELFEGDNKRWFPSTQKDVDLLNIKNELEAPSILRQVTPYGIKQMTHVIYKGLLDEYGDQGLSLFPYDWRKSIFTHVGTLADKIINEANASGEKVTLVAHSMGGMLAKLAIQEVYERQEIEKIQKFISIGTPWHGSPDSYKALLYGEPGIFENLKEILQFITVEGSRELARMFPSVYQLLPSEKYFDHSDGKFIITDNDMGITYDTFKTIIQNIHDRDKEEKDYVDVWENYIEPLHVEMQKELPEEVIHDCLIGHSLPTLYKVPDNSRIGFGIKKYKRSSSFMNGDGVVPIYSAIPSHVANLFFVKGEHSKLCSTPSVLDFLRWSINSNGLDTLPEQVSSAEDGNIPINSSLKAGMMAKIMCPVESTILDEQGRYVAGVFDTNIEEVSDLADSDSVKFFNIGESKYIYFAKKNEEDLTFEIHAYKEGIASVSLEVFEENQKTELTFDTIPVSNEISAKLLIPSDEPPLNSTLEYQGEVLTPRAQETVQVDTLRDTPIPNIKIVFEPTEGVNKVPYRPTYSGPVILKVESENISNVAELFYSLDGKNIEKYEEGIILSLVPGQHLIEVFGKDIYNRPINTKQAKISIDNQPPKTTVGLTIDPEGIFITFKAKTIGSSAETKYRFIESEQDKENIEWKTTELDNKIIVPSRKLRTSPKEKITIQFYSINTDFNLQEEVKNLAFNLGDIPILMWEESTSAVTPKMIWDTVFQHELFDINEFSVKQLIHNKYHDIGNHDIIGDNVKSIRFESESLIVEVLFSEKYSLYFSGSPTELLKLGEEYNFSFELRAERSNENITSTSPIAKLHPLKARGIADEVIPLTEKDGVFYGKFKVNNNFQHYKHKLIITDIKNISPTLREIPLLLSENDE